MDILDQLRRWINGGDTSDNSAPVLWINGLAGTGKTTLAYTIAGECKTPVTSFFCSCNFSEQSNPNLIFPSIAHQLGRIFPLFREKLAEILRSNPHLASASIPFQLEELIVKPLQSLHDPSNLCLVVIDTLDECKDTGRMQ